MSPSPALAEMSGALEEPGLRGGRGAPEVGSGRPECRRSATAEAAGVDEGEPRCWRRIPALHLAALLEGSGTAQLPRRAALGAKARSGAVASGRASSFNEAPAGGDAPLRVLTATSATQGWRASDFFTCVEGELVLRGPVCDMDADDPDGGCGCGRSLTGAWSVGGTTTVAVTETQLTRAAYVETLRASLEACGAGTYLSAEELVLEAEGEAEELLEVAAQLSMGAVLEWRAGVFAVREVGI